MLRRFAQVWHDLVAFIAGEWMLKLASRRPKGGSIVIARSLLTAAMLYAVSISLREMLDPSRSWNFDAVRLRQLLIDTWAWFGGIFAATYASLYGRFASQWTYLANLYNQIKAAEVRLHERGQPDAEAMGALAEWKAGFIEDADDLHLATKPIFASVIVAWSQAPGVEDAFKVHAVGGSSRWLDILSAARRYKELHRSKLPGSKRSSDSLLSTPTDAAF